MRLRKLGHAAAERVVELFPRMHRVGICWGKTIYHLSERIGQIDIAKSVPKAGGSRHRKARSGTPIRFIPVTGDSLTNPDAVISASNLVAMLHRAIGAQGEPTSLGPVAACYPKRFSGAHGEVLHEFFECVPGYRDVFGTRDAASHRGVPLINQVDTLILGIGPATRETNDPWLDDTILAAEISRETLEKISYGNISGYFIPRPRLSASDQKCIDGINERWTGIREEHIAACAARSRQTGAPGVFVLAVGAAKAEIVRVCAHRSLINELIIDEELADALAIHPDAKSSQKP
jgi:DNA-binding transcriptional regulator LsrR (DeoR family)